MVITYVVCRTFSKAGLCQRLRPLFIGLVIKASGHVSIFFAQVLLFVLPYNPFHSVEGSCRRHSSLRNNHNTHMDEEIGYSAAYGVSSQARILYRFLDGLMLDYYYLSLFIVK